ncbi:DUF294 nucleotidyltransferase-like domain-containing protein [Alloalcanivorax sp. C16-2]|uniref:DUF294 nucleotidyltransferase-like domain-containing protein n=1 Tax=Alloalcanivorax TaxID=3020832 RepID=UPI0019344638|nr:DUF294 nucleotidyltransferase-like domain-containing protein [Alloalcanivorax marinus]MBL7250463.1 cyclic nucleotide-binding/CBS domain-containing protein [Alloalcanivorax marinus]
MIDVDFEQPPFSLLDEGQRGRLKAAMEMAYFEAGEVLLEARHPAPSVYLVHKGAVLELDPTLPADAGRLGVYTAGDLFGAMSVLNGRSRYRFVTEEETLCYLIPAELFRTLCEEQPAFADYFRQRLASKNRLLAERREGGVTMAGFMLARVNQCMREPLILPSGGTVQQAVAALNERQVDSLLVERDGHVGVITKTDLLRGLVNEGLTPASPALSLATFELIKAPPEEYLFAALVSMTRSRVERVVVMEGRKPVGVVELTDVLSFFSSRSYVVGLEVERADSLEALSLASARLPELVRALMAQGVKMRFAMDLLAALNGRIISKAFQFVVPEADQEHGCLLVLGSEGRGEQILKTDQDNALILDDAADWPERDEYMRRFTETLLSLGYPRCPGNIMVSNPDWVGSVSRWREQISRWAGQGDDAAMMNLAILIDAHPVAGRTELVAGLREALFQRCSGDQILLSRFARPSLKFSTPLNWFGALKKPDQGIDIKKGGLFPVVHGVRSMTLEQRIEETGTLARLERLVDAGQMEAAFAEELGEAMALFSELRLKQQLMRLEGEAGDLPGNQLQVERLTALERDLLRDSLQVVNEFKKRLSRRFHLEY